MLHVRGYTCPRVLCVTASITIAAGSDGIGGDARPMGTEASHVGAGSEAIGSLVLWTPAGVPTASADTEDLSSGPDDRDRTRHVSHVVRYLSAKGATMPDNECKAAYVNVII